MNYKASVDRAKSYVNDFLKRSDKSSDVIVDEKIWQINKKYIDLFRWLVILKYKQ